MVANFNNYQELVDRALMLEGKQQQIDSRKRKYGQGSIILELNRDPVSPRTREDLFITMEATLIMEEVRTIIVAPRTAMVIEEVAHRTVPTRQHPQEGSKPRDLLQMPEDRTLRQ